MPNLFGITEREYIVRSQIYEEYSVIAKVDRRSVRVCEANFFKPHIRRIFGEKNSESRPEKFSVVGVVKVPNDSNDLKATA